MEISPLFFYIFASIAIAFSLLVVVKKNPIASAFSLVVVFFCFAGIYALMQAHLIATLQILVYAGAIMVLFVFVIMLLSADIPKLQAKQRNPLMYVGIGFMTSILFVFSVWAFRESSLTDVTRGEFTPENIEAAGGNTQVLSELLFSEYILPFELTSVLLLGAIVGAVALAKRKQKVVIGSK